MNTHLKDVRKDGRSVCSNSYHFKLNWQRRFIDRQVVKMRKTSHFNSVKSCYVPSADFFVYLVLGDNV